jgi:predicted transcriptional regulator
MELHTIDVNDSFEAIRMRTMGIQARHFLVLDTGQIAGVISKHDIELIERQAENIGDGSAGIKAKDIMTFPAETVEWEMQFDTVLDKFQRTGAQAVVVTRDGRPVGIIDWQDLFRIVSQSSGEETALSGSRSERSEAPLRKVDLLVFEERLGELMNTLSLYGI